jgi:glycosyltransferase involved in cell wall biosynthesis
MRILVHLIAGELAGGQRVAADIAAALHDRGHEIGVVLPDRGPALGPFEALQARVHIADLGSLRRPWSVVAGARILRGYDLLYSHTSVPGEILGSAAARLARRPQVIHRHNYLDLSSRGATRALQGVLYRAATRDRAVIAVAEHVKVELTQIGAAPDHIVVIPNGTVIPDMVDDRRASEPLRIGMLGRMEPQKGGDLFVGAARRARLTRPATWTIAGPPGSDPGYEAGLRAAAASAGVVVEGRVDPSSAFLSALDIVVIPSRFEGHPLIVLESLALGRAVVATEIDGIREVVEPGSGALVPADDEVALAAAIERLAADDDLRATLGARGRAIARERYDVRQTVRRAVEVVEQAGVSRGSNGKQR